jgi:hypothetical protein
MDFIYICETELKKPLVIGLSGVGRELGGETIGACK